MDDSVLDGVSTSEVAGALATLATFVRDPNSPRNSDAWRLAACLFQIIEETNTALSVIRKSHRELQEEHAALEQDYYQMKVELGRDTELN